MSSDQTKLALGAMARAEVENRQGYNPLDELILAQDSKPDHLAEVNPRTLDPFYRSLLVIDGTVTKFVEAYFMQPIDIVRLSQSVKALPADHRWLEAAKGTDVIAREVLLQGHYDRRVYAYAVSLLAHDRLPQSVKDQLQPGGEGLGRIMLSSRMETFREILWYGKEKAPQLPDAITHLRSLDFISRTYRVIANGAPVMLINEMFPYGDDMLPSHH